MTRVIVLRIIKSCHRVETQQALVSDFPEPHFTKGLHSLV